MYNAKLFQETLWAVVVAVIIAVAELLMGLHPEEIADWRTWAIIAVGSLARAAGIAVLAAIGKARVVGG